MPKNTLRVNKDAILNMQDNLLYACLNEEQMSDVLLTDRIKKSVNEGSKNTTVVETHYPALHAFYGGSIVINSRGQIWNALLFQLLSKRKHL